MVLHASRLHGSNNLVHYRVLYSESHMFVKRRLIGEALLIATVLCVSGWIGYGSISVTAVAAGVGAFIFIKVVVGPLTERPNKGDDLSRE